MTKGQKILGYAIAFTAFPGLTTVAIGYTLWKKHQAKTK